jgi:hypothetical protein
MGQRFKAYDAKYRRVAGTALNTVKHLLALDGITADEIDEAVGTIVGWPHMAEFTEDYSREQIAYAVYESLEADHWQKFRVSLKGLSTKEKIYCLGWYWVTEVINEIDDEPKRRNIIRVNNYLGALKRGGQLNGELIIIKN